MSRRALPFLNPFGVTALAGLAAIAVGVLMGRGAGPGIGATLALLYAPLVLVDLAVGVALWVPITFIQYLPFVWVGPSAASALVFMAWLGTLRRADPLRAAALRQARWLIGALAGLLLWLTLSLAWSQDPGLGFDALWPWYVAAAVLAVILTSVRHPRQVALVVGAFVAGAALSVLLGLAFNGVTANSADAIATAAKDEGRLTGGAGDPNYLAAGLVPAIVLAGALLVNARSALGRLAAATGAAICGVGLAATESRGGLLAAAAAGVAALVFFRRHRALVGGFLLAVVLLMGVWFAASPSALDRVTNFDGSGNGRSDLWHVARVIGNEHPVLGIGIGNFVVEEQRYVRRPGPIQAVALIVDKPHVAHSVYLQMYAETGLPGLVLLLCALLAPIAAAARAAPRFDRLGDAQLATLARALAVGQLSTLVAFLFITDGPDERIWVLFGLGPALYAIAARRSASSPT